MFESRKASRRREPEFMDGRRGTRREKRDTWPITLAAVKLYAEREHLGSLDKTQ